MQRGLPSFATPSFQGSARVRTPPDTHPGPSIFVLIQSVGEDCTAFQKAKVIPDDIIAVSRQANLQIAASTAADLAPREIGAAFTLKK
jgi:hypothetical protein